MLEVIHGTSDKPASTRQLVEVLKNNLSDKTDGFIYVGYPILGTVDGGVSLDVVMVSAQHGVVVFDLIEGRVTEDRSFERDRIYLNTKSRLIQHLSLMNGRELAVGLNVITFAPIGPLDLVLDFV